MILIPGKLYVLKKEVTLYSKPSLLSPTSRLSDGKYIQQIDRKNIVMLVEHIQQYTWSDCKILTTEGLLGWITFSTRLAEDFFKEQ